MSIAIAFALFAFLFLFIVTLLPMPWWWLNLIGLGGFIFILNFFRNPDRSILQKNEDLFYSPADGKVVVIEETFEREVLNDKRLLVSIFMSPLDVHANRIPISGKVVV